MLEDRITLRIGKPLSGCKYLKLLDSLNKEKEGVMIVVSADVKSIGLCIGENSPMHNWLFRA